VAEDGWEVEYGINDLLPIIFKILEILNQNEAWPASYLSVRDLTTIREMLELVWWDYFQAGIIRKIKPNLPKVQAHKFSA
jgi:hypothetical protein